MLFRKFFILTICLILVGQNFAQTETQDKRATQEISAELKEKAVGMLYDLARDADQFYLAENRIEARGLVADLLWEQDEKQARLLFQGAISELEPLVEELLVLSQKEDEESEKYYEIYNVGKLRTDLLMRIAAHDPEFALNTLRLLTRKKPDGKNLFEYDESLEIQLASKISQNDPQKAFDLAIKNLESGLDYNIYSALEEIYKKDEDLGAQFAGEILAKIQKNETKPNSKAEAAVRNSSNPAYRPIASEYKNFSIAFWEVKTFLEKVKQMNRQAAKAKKKPVLTEDEYKKLVEALGERVIVLPYLSAYQVTEVIQDFDKYDPPTAQAVRRKLAGSKDQFARSVESEKFKNEIEDKTVEDILAVIEKKPIDKREKFYRQAAEMVLAKGDVAAAKEIYENVQKKEEYDYLRMQIEEELPLALAEKGNVEESRKMLAKAKNAEERIELLTSLAVSLAAKGDKKSAEEFINEALSLYSGSVKNRRNLASILQLSQATAVLEPEQSFRFLENNISYIDGVINAAILLDEFNENGSVKEGELRLGTAQIESYRDVKKGVALIREFANIDFERTVNLANKFNRREARFIALYRIAEALLDEKAEEQEEKFHEQIQEEYNGH